MSFSEKIPNLIRIGHAMCERVIGCFGFLRRVVPLAFTRTRLFLFRCIKPALFCLVCLITILALYVAEENYRSSKAWVKYLQDAHARGEKLTVAELAPPPVPDEQNLAKTALFKQMMGDNHKFSDTLSLVSFAPDYRSGFGDWQKGRKTDLAKWAVNLQGKDLLTALKTRYNSNLSEISALCQSPNARIGINWNVNPPSSLSIPPYGLLRQLSDLFELRAEAELADGQTEQAKGDAIIMLRLANSTRDEPFLTDMLLASRLFERAVQVVWEGLEENRWNEAQMIALQQEIQRIDLIPEFHRSFECERAYMVGESEWENTLSKDERYKIYFPGRSSSLAVYAAAIMDFTFYRSRLENIEYITQYVLPCINVAARRIDPVACEKASDFSQISQERSFWLHPQIIFQSPYNFTQFFREFAMAQTGMDEAALACALERFKITHSDYPAKLDELAPQFIAKVPNDVISGDPLHYQRTADGRYLLYSVGWDGVDNGGKALSGWFSKDAGDWVWQYTPTK